MERKMRPLILALSLLAIPAAARIETGCTDQACLQSRLTLAMQRLLVTVPDPARQAEIMTAQVLWHAYRDMQCGPDTACQQRQTRWRIEEIETSLK
jgi:hypothetical protein